MACFARNRCLFGGIGTFTTCGCGIDICGMNNNHCQQNCNCCNQQMRCERSCSVNNERGCDNDRGQNNCDRCD